MLQKLDPGSYFGVSSDLYDRDGLSVAETLFPTALEIPAHEHVNPFFCFVMQGQGTRTWHGRAGAEQPMSLTVFPADLPHANQWYGTHGRVLHVEFARPWLERLRGLTKLLAVPADFSAGPPLWLARRIAGESHDQDDVSPLVIEALVLEMLAECSRASSGSQSSRIPIWVVRVHSMLRERFAEKLSLEQLAVECGVSADHLARSFRRCYGCTVGEEIRKLRIEHACRRLAQSDASLSDIALESGFTDQSHLTKVFQRHMRIPPRQFRVQQRGGRSRTKTVR